MGLAMGHGKAMAMWVGRQNAIRRWAEEESALAAEQYAALRAGCEPAHKAPKSGAETDQT